MANTCMARLRIAPKEAGDDDVAFPVEQVKERLAALSYGEFTVVDDEDDQIEIECGFRWSPPLDELLAVTADLHVRMRCLYEEDGCCFMGAWRAEDGKVLQDDSIEYD